MDDEVVAMADTLSLNGQSKLKELTAQLNKVILGKELQIKLALSCILANGHLLLEDLPGMGKTTLSHALAAVFDLRYQRVQFTSDMLPADLLGVSVFDKQATEFIFHPGPIFSQLLLADEINRSNPKTQSALLEAMEEHQVSVDGETYSLPEPFFVIATQNPLHQSGTFPLPESQLDRFLMSLTLGFPPADAELTLLNQGRTDRVKLLPTGLVSKDELLAMQAQVKTVFKSENALNYVMALLSASREKGVYPNALSPRAGLALVAAAQSYCFLNGRDYITPDDIKIVFSAVAEHRLRAGSAGGTSTHYSEHLLARVDPLA